LDETIYSTDFYFPERIVEIISIQDYREVPLAFVQIRPVQYNPKTRKLRCYSKIKYRVVFQNQDITKTIRSEQESFDVLRNVLSNPNMLMEFADKNPTEQLRSGTSKNYIIVTTDRFLPAVQEFAAWKIRMGYSCEIVSQASWISSQVKNAVHTRYNNWNPKPEYLLIVGDHENIPGEIYTHSIQGDYATDLYYVCMDGPTDYTADMARGRVSVNSLEQAYLVLRKIIDYEKTPVIDASFYQTGLNCGRFEDDDLSGYESSRFILTNEEVRDYLINKGKIVNRVYSADSDVYPKYYSENYGNGQPIPAELRKDISPFYPWSGGPTNIINEINAGKFYVLYRGHGNYNSWSRPNFNISNIPNLTNGDKLPVVFSIACQTGGYHLLACFAERLLRHPNGGVVGIVAASQVSSTGWNDTFAVGMFDAIWSDPGLIPQFGFTGNYPIVNSHSDIYKMGYVLNQGLLRMGQTTPWFPPDDYQNRIYHYFGDPSMEMYTASPATFTNPVISQSCTSVTVNTGGVPGCKIALTSSNDDGASYFEVISDVSSHTFTNVTVPCNITITKHNYIPYLSSSTPCNTPIVNFTNQIVTTNTTVTSCCDINIQNVKVQNGAKLTLDAAGEVIFNGDFEVDLGSELEIK
jgi:hypothetical protein